MVRHVKMGHSLTGSIASAVAVILSHYQPLVLCALGVAMLGASGIACIHSTEAEDRRDNSKRLSTSHFLKSSIPATRVTSSVPEHVRLLAESLAAQGRTGTTDEMYHHV